MPAVKGESSLRHTPATKGLVLQKVLLFAPKRHEDNRGWFRESYNAKRERLNGIDTLFVQDNQSRSINTGTVRGIHFQTPPHGQAKLVQCIRGRILDYVIDLRRASPTYGQHVKAELTEENGKVLFIPIGFGHAFITLEPGTEICYKVSDYYNSASDGGIRWDCPDIGIEWPLFGSIPTVSAKDQSLPLLRDFSSPFEYDGVPLSLETVD